MQDAEYAGRIEAVKQRAHGRWSEILASVGVDERVLLHRNLPCPLCGGTDRFQYTDKFGEGNYHCRQCGPGGGFKLLQAVKGVDFNAALCDVERCLGVLPEMASMRAPTRASVNTAAHMQKLVQRIWDEATPVTPGDEVDRYLRNRGLAIPTYPKVLRLHAALGYYEKDGAGKSRKVAEYPAMLACIQGSDGQAVTLHRTYLQDGAKLKAVDAKKVLSAGINGAAVRLIEATDELAVCEGIETGLAVHLATRKPVWSGISAGNLEKLWLPDTVRKVCIYADNDANGDFAGQWHAFALARRLMREDKREDRCENRRAEKREGKCEVERKPTSAAPRVVRVFVPRHAGTDWADVWCQRLTAQVPGAA